MGKYFLHVATFPEGHISIDRTLVTGNLSDVRKLALARFELEFPESPYRIDSDTIFRVDGPEMVWIESAYEDGRRPNS